MSSPLPIADSEDGENVRHVPVLTESILDWLRPHPGAVIADCTVGGGGHAEAILERIVPGGRLIGLDRDPAALRVARERLARFGASFAAYRSDYRALPAVLAAAGAGPLDGLVADLGISSLQLDDAARGFGFAAEGPLDMRLDPTTGRGAADLLATIDEVALTRLLRELGEEPQARPIARAIVRARERSAIVSTRQLAEIVRVAARWRTPSRVHPATRTFMALRIAVNDELTGLDGFVRDAAAALRPGARLCVVSFHSLEDRAIKRALRDLQARCTCPPGLPVCVCGRPGIVRILTGKPVVPTAAEIAANPRSRSAKLRVAEAL